VSWSIIVAKWWFSGEFRGAEREAAEMNSAQRKLYEKAKADRIQVCNWLLDLMMQSPHKPATKDVLREITVQKFGVSKSSFNAGWDMAIIESGNKHWWNPLPRHKIAAAPRH
jgi:hypothetical protein